LPSKTTTVTTTTTNILITTTLSQELTAKSKFESTTKSPLLTAKTEFDESKTESSHQETSTTYPSFSTISVSEQTEKTISRLDHHSTDTQAYLETTTAPLLSAQTEGTTSPPYLIENSTPPNAITE
jgi:hypothetical protein